MQSAEDAANAAANADAQNLLAGLASILNATTAAVPPGPPPAGGQLGGPGGSPTVQRADSGGAAAAAANAGLPPGMLLPGLPGGLPFQLPLDSQGLGQLAPFMHLFGPGGIPGLGGDPGMPYLSIPGVNGQMMPLNLAALLGNGMDLDAMNQMAAEMAGGGDPSRKSSGSKRPGDGSGGGGYKRERSEEGRSRESIPNLPHLKGKCHVEGCNTDLTGLSSYYQRYRTCEVHLKATSIIKDGTHQRFCQQCGRFHELNDFDGNKRSCRSRLQSHNVRRRKRTEEQMANAGSGGDHGGGSQMGNHNSGMGGSQGMQQMGQMPMQQQQMMGGQPNFAEIMGGMGAPTLEGILAALGGGGQQPEDMNNALAQLLANLPQNFLGGLAPPPDAGQVALQLALQVAAGGGGEQQGAPPLLDSLLKSAAGAPGLGPAPGELAAHDLQQQLAMALAGAPSAVGSMGGEASDGAAGVVAALAAAAAAAAEHHHGGQQDGDGAQG